MPKSNISTLTLLSLFAFTGCDGTKEALPERRPRPVVVQELRPRLPPNSTLITAAVASWKTEQIGFEVGGRIESVVEPNKEIVGRITGVSDGEPVARLESERYRLQLDKAKADVVRAEKQLEVAETELKLSLPAQKDAARASLDLAKTEYDRSVRLLERNAGSQGDVDRDKASFQSAQAQLAQLDAATDAKLAEIESLKTAILQAQQAERDAQRNLEDCTLFASFNGQIADVSVVPGSVVSAGQPVATLQMMNPIKVEFEVSAAESRRLEHTRRLPLRIRMPNGASESRDGYVYQIDPVADPLTRTFTVTMLLLNQKLNDLVDDRSNNTGPALPESSLGDVVASTQDVWRLDFEFLPGAQDGMLFIEENAILNDGQSDYVWQVTSETIGSRVVSNRQFQVRKLLVRKEQLKVPFFGDWIFQQISVEDERFDPSVNLVVGKLDISSGMDPSQWNGSTVLMDFGGQWMLRPGDLVQVDLTASNGNQGYYIAMNAISRNGGKNFVFVAEKDGEQTKARQIEVELNPLSDGGTFKSATANAGVRASASRQVADRRGGPLPCG